MSNYIHTPKTISYNDIVECGFSLSSSRHKKFEIANQNCKLVKEFLTRALSRKDLGVEVGSANYIEQSSHYFLRTKALQDHSYLPEITPETALPIMPSSFVKMNLKAGDLIISKDSNIGEIVILDKDYPNVMLSGALYKLPVNQYKYYLLAMMKHGIFRDQLDFIVPKGATIRHAKTLFLDCKIPMPNENSENVIQFVENLTQAIINLHPSLVANDDDYTAHPVNVIHDAAVVGNVLENDTLGGASITDPTQVTITLVDNGGLVGVSFAPNGEVTVPQGAPAGTYKVRYNLCMSQQSSVCDDAVVTIVITKDKPLTIYNGVSSNSDGKNDGFTIEGIEAYPKNTLKIFNRWGVLVYQKEGYTNSDPFTGYSNGRSTIESGKKLPQGTYYYILEYQNSNNQTQTKSGWLYLKRD